MSDIGDDIIALEALGILIDIELIRLLNKSPYIYKLTSTEYNKLINDKNNITLYNLVQQRNILKKSMLF